MGEDRTDDLQDREGSLYEEYVADEGGTGLDYYNEDGYDYEASNPLTDVDYQGGNNESSQFTDNYTGAEDYDPVNRDEPDDDDEYGVASFDDDDEYAPLSYDDEDDDDEDDDDEDDDYDGDGDDGELDSDTASRMRKEQQEQDFRKQQRAAKKNGKNGDKKDDKKPEAKHNVRIPWQPGDRITLALLNKVWFECHKIKKVEELINTANNAARTALQSVSTGSTVILYVKIYDQIRQWTKSSRSDFIGTLLDMASSNGVRWTCTTVSAVQAIFTQTWMDPVLIATLPKILEALLGMQPLKMVLDKLFSVAVPILEGQETRDDGGAKFNLMTSGGK